MKVFKKAALLISVLVLAVVLSVGVIAGGALLSEGDKTLGEVYSGVQVTTDGKVNLKVYYSKLGTAEAFVAKVVDPVSGETDTYNYPVSALEETKYGYCVEVPLAPSEMTHTVSVWAEAGTGDDKVTSTVKEFKVADYANEILADGTESKYHDAMRALLNWGAMAQSKFKDATSVRANTGLFERNSNSIHGVNSISYEEGAVTTNGTTITDPRMNLTLEPGNLAIHFYVNYSGSGELTATVKKGNGDAVDTAITKTEKGWLVRVSNVPATLFDTPYTVTVTDGTDTFTATKTVREYLGVLLAQCNESGDLATGNTVRALYQFYQFTTGKTGADTCAHSNNEAVYWIATGANTQEIRCNYCHKELGHADIGSNVNAYAPAQMILKHYGRTGMVDSTYKEENGVQFVRFDNYIANQDANGGWGDINISSTFVGKKDDSGNATVSGQYLVVKYRVGAEGNGKTVIDIFANTNKGSITGLTATGQTKFVKSNDNQWHTVIINLEERVTDPTVAFVDEGDGTYDVRYMSLRLFTGSKQVAADAEPTDPARCVYKYTRVNAETEKTETKNVYGAPMSEEEITAGGWTLEKINETTLSKDAYVDIAYMALCDSPDEAKSLVDTTVYEKSTANDKSLYYNTADDSCAHVLDGKETVEGNTYSYNCVQCGEALYSKTVPESVTKYMSANDVGTSAAQYYQAGKGKLHLEDGVVYTRSVNNLQILWSRIQADFNGGTGANLDKIFADVGNAEYLVVKARVAADATSNLSVTLSTAGKNGNPDGEDDNTYPDTSGYKSVTLVSKGKGDGKWHTYVIDLKALLGDYWAKAEGAESYVVDTFYLACGGTFDVAYMAFVDGGDNECAAIDALVDEKTIYKLTSASGGAYVELNTADHTCFGEHTKGSMQNVDGVYKFPCTICGAVLRDTGVSVDAVNAYWSAETLYIKATQSNAASGWASITGTYAQKDIITEDGETYVRVGDATATSGWHGWFPVSQDGKNGIANAGRYMVMKVRNNTSTNVWNTLPFWITSSKSTANWGGGSFSVSLPQDNQWHVIVVDLAARSTEYKANEDGTYGLKTIHLRPMLGDNKTMNNSTDETFDIAYMAFFDDLADLKDIVKEEYFELSKSGSSSIVLETATGACKYHNPTYVADAEDARGYHYECAECGKKFAMDYYTSGMGGTFAHTDSKTGAVYKGTATLKTDAEGFRYMSFLSTGASGTFFDYNTNTGGGGGVSPNAVRAGRYLVVKLKGDTAADVKFHVGTDDIEKKNDNYRGGYLGSLTVETMPKEWTVAVIDLTGLANYTLGGTHKIFFSSTTGGGTTVAQGAQVDIAYMMLVNDIHDIPGLTEGENVQYYGNSFNNAPVGIDEICDGTKHTYDVATATENGVTTNTATCVVCGATKVQTVSADVNWFAPLSGMDIYKHTLNKGLLDAEDGVMFNRYTRGGAEGGNHLNLTGGSGNSGVVASGTFPTGKYIAIKYRLWVEGGTGTFNFNVATGDKKNGNGESMGILDYTSINQGEWRVAIMDASSKAQWTSDGSAQSIYMMITTGGSGDYTFDIAWLAVVDSVDEMKTLLREGETYYDLGSDWSKAGTHLNQDGICADGCTWSISNGANLSCSKCGLKLEGSISRNHTGLGDWTNYSVHNNNNAAGKATTGQTDPDTGYTYSRMQANPDSTNETIQGRNLLGGSSLTSLNYIVIRYRVGENGLDQKTMNLYFNTQDEAHSIKIPVAEDNTWHTVVIDLNAYVGDGTVYTGTYTMGYFRPFGDVSGSVVRTNPDAYVDMSFAMGCRSLEHALKYLGTDTYEWFNGETIEVRDSATREVVSAE